MIGVITTGLGMASFGLASGRIAVRPNRDASVRNELRVATLNQIAGFGDDVLQEFENLPQAGLMIDDLGDGLTQGRIGFDFTGGVQRACRGFVLDWAWCHINDAAPV